MEVLPRAVASSSVVVATSSPSSSGSSQRKVPKSLPFVIPYFRPASAFAASILASAPPAALAALNYDDIVKKATQSASESASSFPDLPSVDLPAINFDGASDFVSANPVALVVGALAVAVPFIASRAVAGTTPFGSVSAAEAYQKLADPDQNAQLLDIRAPADIKAEGSPNLKSIRKTVIKVAYAADDDKFVDKVLAKCKIAEGTTLYVLDRFDGNAAAAAKLLANSGFDKAYAVKGGAEGQNGWVAKELPWATPSKAFNLDIGGLKNILPDGEGAFQGEANLSTVLGVAAAAGIGVVAVSEIETTLQLLGTVALVQIFVKKFLFAKDRNKTINEISTLLDQKIAPNAFVDEIKDVGRVLVPKDSEVQAAIGTGAAVIEKKLDIDSVTPQALGEKAVEKLGEEAEKAGVEIPDLGGVTADLKSGAKELQSNVESVTSDLKSGAKDLQSKTEEVTSDLQSGAQDLQSKAGDVASDLKSETENVASDVQSKAEGVAADAQSKTEDVSSGLQSKVGDVQSKAEDVAGDVQSKVEGVASDVQSKTEDVSSDLQSKAEDVAGDVQSKAEGVASDVQSKTEDVSSDLQSKAGDVQSKAEDVAGDVQSKAEGVASDVQSKTEDVSSDLQSKAGDVQSKAEDVAGDVQSKAEGVASDVQSKTEDVSSDLQSKAGDVSSDVQSKAEDVSSDVESNVKAAGADLKEGAKEAESAVESATESTKPGNGSAAPSPADTKVVPFFEDERDSARAAFEGDEPNAFEEQVGEDIGQKKLEGVTTSGSSDSSS